MIVDNFCGAGEKRRFRWAPRGFLPRISNSKINSNTRSKGKTGAVRSSFVRWQPNEATELRRNAASSGSHFAVPDG